MEGWRKNGERGVIEVDLGERPTSVISTRWINSVCPSYSLSARGANLKFPLQQFAAVETLMQVPSLALTSCLAQKRVIHS